MIPSGSSAGKNSPRNRAFCLARECEKSRNTGSSRSRSTPAMAPAGFLRVGFRGYQAAVYVHQAAACALQQAQRFFQPGQKPNPPRCEAEGRCHVSPSDPMDARREPAAGVKPQLHQHNNIVVLGACQVRAAIRADNASHSVRHIMALLGCKAHCTSVAQLTR